MEEIFELIKAFNRLKEKVVELIGKIDLLLKSPAPGGRDATSCVSGKDAKSCVSGKEPMHCVSERDAKYCVSTDGYVEEEGACRILHICPRTLAKLRSEGAIPYIKSRKKILYQVSDLHEYINGSITGTG